MRTISEWKKEYDAHAKAAAGGKISLPGILKKEIISIHYETGTGLKALATAAGVSFISLTRWQKEYGQDDEVGFLSGSRLLLDVRTKCLAIRDNVEKSMSTREVAEKYNVSVATIYSWKTQYKDRYKEYIATLPEGIARVVPSYKLVVGAENISTVRAFIQEQKRELYELGESFNKCTLTTFATPKEVKEEIDEKIVAMNAAK